MIKRYYERDPKPERLAGVKEQYLNMHTTKAMITMNCIVNQLDLIEQAMEKRIRSIPRGWANWRMARKNLQTLLDDLLYTIPQSKFDPLITEINRTRCEYRQGPAATVQKETDMVIQTDHAIALCYYSHEYNCKQVCTKDSCDACKLGQALDFCLTLDRNGKPWNRIDITQR